MQHINNNEIVLEALRSGKNVFLTGAAGSGKTSLLRKFRSETKKNIFVCAPTGIAASSAQGETIHRFLRLGMCCRPEDAPKICKKWDQASRSAKPWDRQRWQLMQILDGLIIDEVSMLRRDLFELINYVLCHIRKTRMLFGGLQMILVGDLLQLPPVVTEDDERYFPDLQQPFVFQSPLWKAAKFESFNLTTNYRQSDPEFSEALNEIRWGNVSDKVDALMAGRVGASLNSDVRPIHLYTINKDVDRENILQLNKLPKVKKLSRAVFTGDEYNIDILKKECIAEEKLVYCLGAQVMMLNNEKNGRWVNGSIGRIVKADNADVRVQFSSGEVYEIEVFTWERKEPVIQKGQLEYVTKATMTQYPFKLAYATSIHKSQSLTLDSAEIEIKSCFAPGQAYVALSRVRNLDGLILRNWDKQAVFADACVADFYNRSQVSYPVG